MMIWNSMFFNFPANSNMMMIHLLMDYTIMLMIFVIVVVSLSSYNMKFSKNYSMEFLSNHELEMVWSIIPFMILIMLAIPTLEALYNLESCEFCGLTMKITGYQWYWSYCMDNPNSNFFNSYMNSEEYNLRLLDSDNSMMVPLLTPIRVMLGSNDVIHSWTIPSAGMKMDAIPGRINQMCFTMDKLGKFFGQCSEICGANHSFMPISLETLELKNFLKMINK